MKKMQAKKATITLKGVKIKADTLKTSNVDAINLDLEVDELTFEVEDGFYEKELSDKSKNNTKFSKIEPYMMVLGTIGTCIAAYIGYLSYIAN